MFAAGNSVSWVQWASIAGALVSVAFIVADLDRVIDTSAGFRMDHAPVHGYLPNNKWHAGIVSIGTFLFVSGMVTSKWVAIASLATASGVVTWAWIITEYVVISMLRWATEGESTCTSCSRHESNPRPRH